MAGKCLNYLIVLILFSFSAGIAENTDCLPHANPWDVGMNYEFVNQAFQSLTSAVNEKASPGAVGLILKDGKVVARRAVGNMQTVLLSRSEKSGLMEEVTTPVRLVEEALFDLASLTKMIATTTSVMILFEQSKFKLDDPVCKYIPSFGQRGKETVTIRHLLTHSSGLPAWYPFWEEYISREDVFRAIDEDIELLTPPGKKRVYSDLGFITLGRLVEAISGQRLDQFAKSHIFEPLGMLNTTYLPRLKERLYAAPTEYDPWRNRMLRGIVHDENARVMGGISGHAGLFSTVDDLALFTQMLLNKGELKGKRILKEETITAMLTPQLDDSIIKEGSSFLQNRRQLLGWWGMNSDPVIGNLGGLPSPTAFGHTGFTGTILFIDPQHRAAAILLSNAIHPRREEASKKSLYRDFFINVSKALVGEAAVKTE